MNLKFLQIFTEKLSSDQTQKKVHLLSITVILLTLILVHFSDSFSSLLLTHEIKSDSSDLKKPEKECDIFSGNWVENREGPYYNNRTCDFKMQEQNCMKFGRTDEEFLKWRWKPDECELPLFDGFEFLEMVRGKSLAFVGDSIARNQMQSLMCLLSNVSSPKDISKNASDIKFRTWFYPDYNFTISKLWSPFLVKSNDLDPTDPSSSTRSTSLYLDQSDEVWTVEIEQFDYVIISVGVWFLRPLILYENNQIVGCYSCQEKNMTEFEILYPYKMAFRAAFRSLNGLENYKGLTFLRTYSPSHFENGEWNKGGSCRRTSPVGRTEMKFDWFSVHMLQTQMAEFGEAEKKGFERGLKFRVLNVTEAMVMRPDGHPNRYVLRKNQTVADCVHWCLPGPIDTWNEFLVYMLKKEKMMEKKSLKYL